MAGKHFTRHIIYFLNCVCSTHGFAIKSSLRVIPPIEYVEHPVAIFVYLPVGKSVKAGMMSSWARAGMANRGTIQHNKMNKILYAYPKHSNLLKNITFPYGTDDNSILMVFWRKVGIISKYSLTAMLEY